MENPTEQYWKRRLENCQTALAANHFEAYLAEDLLHARRIVEQRLLPHLGAQSAAWGDSLTFYATGLLDVIKASPQLRVIETFDDTVSRETVIERRRQALLVDLFFSGSNAVTETGVLVNLDMVGNRVAPLAFGPRHVILLVGRNKIVPDLSAAVRRIKEFAAPVNAIRHRFKTPCVKTSHCMDCASPSRICNSWAITEKSFPHGRIKVVLINEDLGF